MVRSGFGLNIKISYPSKTFLVVYMTKVQYGSINYTFTSKEKDVKVNFIRLILGRTRIRVVFGVLDPDSGFFSEVGFGSD